MPNWPGKIVVAGFRALWHSAQGSSRGFRAGFSWCLWNRPALLARTFGSSFGSLGAGASSDTLGRTGVRLTRQLAPDRTSVRLPNACSVWPYRLRLENLSRSPRWARHRVELRGYLGAVTWARWPMASLVGASRGRVSWASLISSRILGAVDLGAVVSILSRRGDLGASLWARLDGVSDFQRLRLPGIWARLTYSMASTFP